MKNKVFKPFVEGNLMIVKIDPDYISKISSKIEQDRVWKLTQEGRIRIDSKDDVYTLGKFILNNDKEFKLDTDYPCAFLMHDFQCTSFNEEAQSLCSFYFELKPKSQAVEPLPLSIQQEVDSMIGQSGVNSELL